VSKFRILVIPAWFNHRNKSEGLFVHQFCETLQNNGFEVSLLYIQIFSVRQFFQYLEPVRFNYSNNFRVLSLKKLSAPYFLTGAVTALRKSLLRKAIRITKNEKFDIIHLQSVCNNISPFVGAQLSKELHIPYVLTEHYSSFQEAGDAMFFPYTNMEEVKAIVKGASVRMGVSNYACDLFERFFKCSFQTFPNIINDIFFSKSFKLAKNAVVFRFIIVAALEKHKGHSLLIEAFNLAFRGQEKVHLDIIGIGSCEGQLKKMITDLHLEERITLLGKLSPEGIIHKIDSSNVTVSASFYETFGLTLVESFLRGKPVISTRSGGPNELVNETNGYLCNVNDVADLSRCLRRMYESYKLFDLEKIRIDAISKYSADKLVNELKGIYKFAIQNPNQYCN
jgi:L-malate glycosyltransferase